MRIRTRVGARILELAVDELVYYSVVLPDDAAQHQLLWQLDESLASLRAHNGLLPVVLFVHGELSPQLHAVAWRHRVLVHQQEPYETRLGRHLPPGGRALSRYPLLHKFLNFRAIAAVRPRQVLYLDCDTLLFDDVALLFERYAVPGCFAREEALCRRSPHGYDPSYLDEAALEALGREEGVRPTPPFNLGAVLFNHCDWEALAGIEGLILRYAWRLAVWLAGHPPAAGQTAYPDTPATELLRAHREQLIRPQDVAMALPFPSVNRWLLDEVALWLALGHLPGLRTGDFSPLDVLQNGEFMGRDPSNADWILCHYYSQNTERMRTWLMDGRARQAVPYP